MDGYELAGRLRQDARLVSTPLVAVTGYGQLASAEKASSAGFSAHLVKPVDPQRLTDLLHSLLEAPR